MAVKIYSQYTDLPNKSRYQMQFSIIPRKPLFGPLIKGLIICRGYRQHISTVAEQGLLYLYIPQVFRSVEVLY